jgi:3',5'-cyclic AMP phosphodiesterase CpdA
MTLHNPDAGYEKSLDVRDLTRHAQTVQSPPRGGVCWVLLAPRRGGKTWALRAIAQAVTKPWYEEMKKSPFVPSASMKRANVVLLDEPGFALREDPHGFVASCEHLERDHGAHVVVAMTPGEYELLHGVCARRPGSVENSVLSLDLLNDAQQQALAGTDEFRALLPRIPAAWRRRPFFLTLLYAEIEREPALAGDIPRAIQQATKRVEGDRQYTWHAWSEGLSDSQRATVRDLVRGTPADRATVSLLKRANVLTEADDRHAYDDPILGERVTVLRVHHVSDIHVGPKAAEVVDNKAAHSRTGSALAADAAPRFVRDTYIDHLAAVHKKGRAPHVLVCSGDCVEYASDPKQIKDFEDWLVRVKGHLAAHRELTDDDPRMVFTGGNHDVDWTLAAKGDRERHAAFARMVVGSPHPHLEHAPEKRPATEVTYRDLGVSFSLLGSAEHGGSVDEDPFRKALLQALTKIPTELTDKDGALRDRLDGLRERLRFDPLGELRAILDAAMSVGVDKDTRRKVDDEWTRVMRADPGFVHHEHIQRLRTEGAAAPVRIAVLHHPITSLPQTEVAPYGGLVNAGDVKNALIEQGFKLVLHGHVHRGWFTREDTWNHKDERRSLWVASAPTLGSRETETGHGFNEVEIVREYVAHGHPRYEIHVSRYERKGTDWVKGASMEPIVIEPPRT